MMRVITLITALWAVMLPIRAYAAPVDTGGKTCLAAGCHANMLDAKFIHGPVAVGDCLMCHKSIGEHKFALAADGADLCLLCHEEIKGGCATCTACHDPHGSDNASLLKPGATGRCCREAK